MTTMNNKTELPVDHAERMARARLALEGLSVGDAFGQQFFSLYANIDQIVAERGMPAAPWYWTDDTAMAISIVEELECSGAIDQDGLADRFAERHAAEPHRGYGGMAHRILTAITSGAAWSDVSPKAFDGQGSMGNGGAMRVAPVGAYFADDYDAVVVNARRSAEVTHAHPDGQAGAIAIAVAAAFVSQAGASAGRDLANEMFATVLERTPDGLTRTGILQASELSLDADVNSVIHQVGNGSQVISYDTVPFTLWCVARHMDSYEEALWTAVLGLGDVDTTAAIVGGIVINGRSESAIPQEWIESREALPV